MFKIVRYLVITLVIYLLAIPLLLSIVSGGGGAWVVLVGIVLFVAHWAYLVTTGKLRGPNAPAP